MLLTSVSPWAEAVLHVLAHVRATAAFPSSLYDAGWMQYAERTIGRSAQRSLAEDASVLGDVLRTDAALSQAQLVAWLFQSAARVVAVRERNLSELVAADVDRPELLKAIQGPNCAAIEVLRAAAELEMEPLASVASWPFDEAGLAWGVEQLVPVAPALARCTIALARPLGIRGRLYEDAIWVGVPNDALGVSIEHVSVQAAHEATVREVLDEGHAGYVTVEREAVARLARRANEAGLAEVHQRWLRRFRVP